MKSQTVYKICRKVGRSRMSMCSPSFPEELHIRYPLRKKVKPEVGGIFVFAELSFVTIYFHTMTNPDSYVVVECTTVSDITPISFAVPFNSYSKAGLIEVFEDFWELEHIRDFGGLMSTPYGTCTVKSLTPIKEIKL